MSWCPFQVWMNGFSINPSAQNLILRTWKSEPASHFEYPEAPFHLFAMHVIIEIVWLETKYCDRNCFISFHHHVYIGEVAWVVTRLTGTSTITTSACCFVHHLRPWELGERTFPYIMYFTLKCWISKKKKVNTSLEVPQNWRS